MGEELARLLRIAFYKASSNPEQKVDIILAAIVIGTIIILLYKSKVILKSIILFTTKFVELSKSDDKLAKINCLLSDTRQLYGWKNKAIVITLGVTLLCYIFAYEKASYGNSNFKRNRFNNKVYVNYVNEQNNDWKRDQF